MGDELRQRAEVAMRQLHSYILEANYAGYDPYDGLNSHVLKLLGIPRIRPLARIAQQAIKRLPLNLRPLLLVPRGQNPKGLALCLDAATLLGEAEEARALINRLVELRSPGFEEACWGYNFRWESRLFSLPPFSPNAVCTSFAGNALLDAHEQFGHDGAAELARSAALFLCTRLNVTENEHGRCFSYTMLDRSITHNINLLVSAFLYRAAEVLKEPEFADGLDGHLRLTLAYQRADGAWAYGEDKGNAWVDGIHQGFNIIALEQISACMGGSDERIEKSIDLALDYYLQHLFDAEGRPKYFDTSLFPIDAHTAATALIALHKTQHRSGRATELLDAVLSYTLNKLWLTKKNCFAYQKGRWGLNRTPFMRWVQSWMLLALATVLSDKR